MLRSATVTQAQQDSRLRVCILAAEFGRAIGVVLADHPDLTFQEVLVALNHVSARQLMHLMSDDEHAEKGPTDGR